MDFVSFGPCCLGAELLRALELRECSYGFDWSRSGSMEHRDFLRLGAVDFFDKHVKNPIIRMRQISSPHSTETKTAEIEPVRPIYGYPYTYNPHRSLSNKSDLNYLARCYTRLEEKLNCKNKRPLTIILSDYTNKKGYTHFPNPTMSAQYLLSAFLLYRSISPRIRIIRYTVSENITENTVDIQKMEAGDLVSVKIPSQIDNDKNSRRQYYKRLYPLFI